MRNVTAVVYLAAAAITILSEPLDGQQAASPVGPDRLTDFAEVHLAISAARNAFHERLGRAHDEQARARARDELERRVTEILARVDMTEEEYAEFIRRVSMDPETRAAFEAVVRELTQNDARPPQRE